MPIEIERKFLVIDDSWRQTAGEGMPIRQGYLVGEGLASVRVRLCGHQANLNIKGRTLGVRRQEFEYPIPVADARILLETLCAKPLIEKIRYPVWFEGHEWEVDVFEGALGGEGSIRRSALLQYRTAQASLPGMELKPCTSTWTSAGRS